MRIAAFCLALAGGAATFVLPASASIYDAPIMDKVDMSAAEKSQVQGVLNKSLEKRDAIFAKYGIDPNAKPNFDLLQKASNELQAMASKERRQLSKILNKAQMKQYDAVIADTRARIIKATR
jgi:hypothetical protein